MPRDYEIIGYDPVLNQLIQWDAVGDTNGTPGPYGSATSPEEWGLDDMTGAEMAAILRDGWVPKS